MIFFKKIFLFGIAGVLGFLVDSVVLYLLAPISGIYVGRFFSFLLAVIVTWMFNRNFTFKHNKVDAGLLAEFLKYLSLMIVGGVINLGMYYFLISSMQFFHTMPIAAVAAGSLAGMAANFLTSQYILYRK